MGCLHHAGWPILSQFHRERVGCRSCCHKTGWPILSQPHRERVGCRSCRHKVRVGAVLRCPATSVRRGNPPFVMKPQRMGHPISVARLRLYRYCFVCHSAAKRRNLLHCSGTKRERRTLRSPPFGLETACRSIGLRPIFSSHKQMPDFLRGRVRQIVDLISRPSF